MPLQQVLMVTLRLSSPSGARIATPTGEGGGGVFSTGRGVMQLGVSDDGDGGGGGGVGVSHTNG